MTIIAQTIRAILLASATAATFVGRRASNAVSHASSESELLKAFHTMAEHKAGALLVEGDPIYTSQMNWLVALTARHKLPTIYSMGDEVVEAGGLMNYSVDVADQYRDAALYVARILKGERPSDLPVQQATKMRFMINRKTADTLGIVIPPHLYIVANDVIE